MPNRFRFPFYPQIHWYAALRYVELLEKDLEIREKKMGAAEKDFLENKENYGEVENDVKKSLKKIKKETKEISNDAVTSSEIIEENGDHEDKDSIPKDVPWEPIVMTEFEVCGVKQLIERLRNWDRAINNYPSEVTDQKALLDRLEVSRFSSTLR